MLVRSIVAATILIFGCLGPAALAAEPKLEDLANDPPLFIQAASKLLKWKEPAEPARILGPIYFVGTKGLGVFLIAGSEGHVLIGSGMPGSGPVIEASIRKLGFKIEDVKLILGGHAHLDHAGGHAYLKKASGAKVAAMREEQALYESGGKSDFHYAAYKEFQFDPVKVDRLLRDEEDIRLGDIAIQAFLTPGHTKGSTTFVLKVVADGEPYTVVIPDGTNVNPGYRLAQNPSYEGIADDFRRTFRVLESLKPDVWLAAHNHFYGLEDKLARAKKEGNKAWVDPEGYKTFVAAQKTKFEAALKERPD